MPTYTTTVFREVDINGDYVEVEIPITITYDVEGPSRGHRDSFGAQEEPDEDGYVEITSVVETATGQEIELTNKEEKEILSELEEETANEPDDCPEPEERDWPMFD